MSLAPAQAADRPRVLIVEDNYLMAEAVGDLVRDCGLEVAGTVGEVERGIEFLSRQDVDGAVVDINLHGRPSFPICHELQQRNTPFVFLSGYSSRAMVPAEFRQARLLSKPVDPRELRAALTAFADTAATDFGSHADRGNQVLNTLAGSDWQELRARLEQVPIEVGQVLESPWERIAHVHFPIGGLVSVVAQASRGRRIEVALVGSDGATGTAVMLGRDHAAGTASVVRSAGTAWRIAAEELMPLLQRRRGLHVQLLRYVHSFLAQMAETALAVGHDHTDQRLARWLLQACDRLGVPSVAVTHEQLAQAMGVRRSGATVALHMLESKGLIRSRRRLVEIRDRDGLARAARGL